METLILKRWKLKDRVEGRRIYEKKKERKKERKKESCVSLSVNEREREREEAVCKKILPVAGSKGCGVRVGGWLCRRRRATGGLVVKKEEEAKVE